MKIENIKVCAFDAYGTCFDINSAAEKMAKDIGENWLAFSTTWRTTQLEYTWLRSLMKKHVNFWKITEDSLNFAMENHNINPKFKNQLLDLYKKLNAYPELRDCLIKLKNKKIKTCILSNGTPDLLDQLVTNSNIKDLFDDLISIEKVGVYKPDPKVYALVIDQYNCKPNEVCFMSSNTWDVVGGGVFGYQSVWVDRFNKVFDQLDFMPKFRIKNLSELDKII